MSTSSRAATQQQNESPLLKLPKEVLLKVLCLLDLKSIVRATQLSKTFRMMIVESSQLQYITALELNGLRDNTFNRLSVKEKLERLKERENGFNTLKTKKRFELGCYKGSIKLYDLVSGVLSISSDNTPQMFQFWEIPGGGNIRPDDEVDVATAQIPRTFHPGFNVKDFTFDPSQDLLVFLERWTPPQWPEMTHPELGNQAAFGFRAHLFTLSTFEPHPLARHPVLFSPFPLFDISAPVLLQIVGDTIAIHAGHNSEGDSLAGGITLFNWKTSLLLAGLEGGDFTYHVSTMTPLMNDEGQSHVDGVYPLDLEAFGMLGQEYFLAAGSHYSEATETYKVILGLYWFDLDPPRAKSGNAEDVVSQEEWANDVPSPTLLAAYELPSSHIRPWISIRLDPAPALPSPPQPNSSSTYIQPPFEHNLTDRLVVVDVMFGVGHEEDGQFEFEEKRETFFIGSSVFTEKMMSLSSASRIGREIAKNIMDEVGAKIEAAASGRAEDPSAMEAMLKKMFSEAGSLREQTMISLANRYSLPEEITSQLNEEFSPFGLDGRRRQHTDAQQQLQTLEPTLQSSASTLVVNDDDPIPLLEDTDSEWSDVEDEDPEKDDDDYDSEDSSLGDPYRSKVPSLRWKDWSHRCRLISDLPNSNGWVLYCYGYRFVYSVIKPGFFTGFMLDFQPWQIKRFNALKELQLEAGELKDEVSVVEKGEIWVENVSSGLPYIEREMPPMMKINPAQGNFEQGGLLIDRERLMMVYHDTDSNLSIDVQLF